jgi:predicted S18 family serine protease
MSFTTIGKIIASKKIIKVGSMKSKLLTFLLVISLVANAYFIILFEGMPSLDKGQVQELQTSINNLQNENEDLRAQINQDNQSIKSYPSQLGSNLKNVLALENYSKTSLNGLQGFATLQGPAVFQSVRSDSTDPFGRQSVTEEGTLINISAEVQPGKGRVLVQTTPLMGVVFQDAANTAVTVAENKTGKPLSGSDIIFSINAKDKIPGVDGPSAGALMTLLAMSAIDNNIKLNDSITLTGTIDSKGNVGAIGGVLEKAQAAKDGGKTLFLIPEENSDLVVYNDVERNFHGLTFVESMPETVSAKEYIEKNVGIRTEYVHTIDDILEYEK